MWSTASHYGNPSFFKYGQHICRTKSPNASLEGHVTVDQTQRNVGQGRTNCTCLGAITRRPHEHVNRLPNALTADCLLSLRGQANVRTRREEQAATVLKVASAQKEREDERSGEASDVLRLNPLICFFSISLHLHPCRDCLTSRHFSTSAKHYSPM